MSGPKGREPSLPPLEGGDAGSELGERFRQALAMLRQGVRAQGSKGWWQSRRQLQQLPWYLIIGAPGGGKTTALLHSGLRFPLAERLGRDPLAGSGGTRQCDWWFSQDAVFIDTAGRLQIDEPMMQELVNVKGKVNPTEILLVADAMTGQEAVSVAQSFHDRLGVTGPELLALVEQLQFVRRHTKGVRLGQRQSQFRLGPSRRGSVPRVDPFAQLQFIRIRQHS